MELPLGHEALHQRDEAGVVGRLQQVKQFVNGIQMGHKQCWFIQGERKRLDLPLDQEELLEKTFTFFSAIVNGADIHFLPSIVLHLMVK